jgi:deoxyribonuclease-4
MGAEVVQVFTQSPRQWRPTPYEPEALRLDREAIARGGEVRAVFCHATYLINLASPDSEVRERSRACLRANLEVASAIGSAGLVLHPGSHRGRGRKLGIDAIAEALLEALASVPDPCPILVENTAGSGDTLGRTFDELAAVIDRAGSDPRLGVCLDTQHLFAGGVDFSTIEAADAAVEALSSTVGLERLWCLHVNDSAVARGTNRDRHANIGQGRIGAYGLACLLGHPALQELPAVLETPGVAGDGPGPEEVLALRRVHAAGLALRTPSDGRRGSGADAAAQHGRERPRGNPALAEAVLRAGGRRRL